jgi:hypothetical protein
MPIRFQADADFNQIIVSAVARRYQEIDIRTATAAGLKGLKEAEVWPLPGTTAPSSSHMTTRRCQGTSKSSSGQTRRAGLIIVPQSLPVRAVVDALNLIWVATQPEEWINRIAHLPI